MSKPIYNISLQKLDPACGVIKIFIIAGQSIYVDGLVRVISDNEAHQVVACKQPGNDCFVTFTEKSADILLVEKSVVEEQLKKYETEGLFSKFLDLDPELRIIVFGHDITESFVKLLYTAGVRGFIDINTTQDMLITAIDEVYNGGYWVGREALEQLINNSVEMNRIVEQGIRDKIESVQDTLTRREVDVLIYVLEGMATKQIAHALNVSEQSVKLYLGRMFKKFEVTNRSQLILMAFQRVCPATNMIQLFRSSLDKRRLRKGGQPLIPDPLAQM